MPTATSSLPVEDHNNAPLAHRLRQFRTQRGLSRDALAAELGVTTTTLYRWETGSTKPSPLAAQKLQEIGFGTIRDSETNAGSVPRLATRAKHSRNAAAEELREASVVDLTIRGERLSVVPAAFVRNGPPDQNAFHRTLLELQTEASLIGDLPRRLSLVESVVGIGATSQHQLEQPRPTAVSWNSNYGSHGWHRYVGRFPAHLVRALLNHFGANQSTVVCDPFVGSGTTAVECRLLGVPFVGIEICPLSAMITRTKAAFPPNAVRIATLAKEFKSYFDARWSRFVQERAPSEISHDEILARPGNPIPSFANVERWFTPQALLGTSITVEFGLSRASFDREVVLLALSSKMRSIGNVDVDVVRAEYSKEPRKNVDVGRLVLGQLNKMASDVAASLASHQGLIGPASSISVIEGSVLDVDLGAASIDHVITSPPYGVEAISYLRTHLLSYRSLIGHLGHDPYDTRDKTIGSEYLTDIEHHAGQRAMRRSPICRTFFSNPHSDGEGRYESRRAAMMQFCDDMLAVGERLARWVRPGGKVAFVIGNKRLGDGIIPMDTIVSELFATCGLAARGGIRHKLKTNNSNSQVPWQERIIQDESVLFFERT